LVFALVGSHGINEDYVYELRTLFNTCPPVVETVVHSTLDKFFRLSHESLARHVPFREYGL
jgi:hypothetical protein